VIGCEVNGPASSGEYAVIFGQEKIVKRVKIVQALETFLQQIRSLVEASGSVFCGISIARLKEGQNE